MRFDDMIATVLAQPARGAADNVARWRQLVDLLAQRRAAGAGDTAEPAYAWLAEHRAEVGLLVRQQAAQTLAWRRIEPRLLGFFAADHPSVAQPLVSTCRLDAAEWLALLPSLSPTARGLLRHRRDLPAEVEQALSAFGKSDFQLGSPEGAAAAPAGLSPGAEKGEVQIRELVARIEAYRRQKESAALEPAPGVAEAEAEPSDGFRWECGPDGIVLWVHGAPRGPLVGQSIASIAERGQFGVDGQAAGAFEKRSPFRDARFSVAGEGPAAGDWRISGVPFFEPYRGHFLGYRGSARRPRLDEVARSAAERAGDGGVFGTKLPADSLRQLIHELRTPLNAIVGFAEMIDGQYMGPAADQYRTRAADIMEQARRLLTAVDDLDTAARIETSRLDLDESSVDAVALLCRLHDSYERVAGQRRASIAIEIARNLPPARVEAAAAERMFSRLLAATIGLAREGETIAASMRLTSHGGERMLCLAIDRPRAIEGLEERALLDPGYSPEGDWPGAPVLGLGFSLRLVRNLAEAVGGGLAVGETRFSLYLPPLEGSGRTPGDDGRGEQGEGAGG
ncbi:MAG TPA: HAMP domain-containing sensor histidine kinase [Allosphingosinicella sp.]